jgi:hypothetical protein
MKKRTVWGTLKKNRVSIALLLLVIGCAYLMPDSKVGILALFTTKMMGISIGILAAHYTRLYLFPYLDLDELIQAHHGWGVGFLIAWYMVIIYCFSMGG